MWSSPAGGASDGGDWCDLLAVSDGELRLTIGDVAGHGADASHSKAITRASVLHAIREMSTPSDVLSAANGVVTGQTADTIVTAIVAFFDGRRRQLRFSIAGHPPPLVVTREGSAFLTQMRPNLPLGVVPQHRATDSTVTLERDAMVVFYTDGVTERDRDPIRGELELVEAARAAYARPQGDAARTIAERVFSRGPGPDDAALMVLRVSPLRRDLKPSESIAR
jgi:serine phosphatase RsbU (regulator of sigma subunit)